MIRFEHTSSLVSRFASLASFVSLALLFAGCATKYGEFEPKPELEKPNPGAYSGYGNAMAHCDGCQMAYEWQQANPKLVADATRKEALAKFVASEAAADALLAKIGTSYDGDPVVLTQIAAVTQLVMCPKCPKAKQCRALWVAALKRARSNTDDGYVRTFCDQQLRICE